MNPNAKLTCRESEFAERIAWGASLKEVATALGVSLKTADNHLQRIKRKIGCSKLNEISAWWFCTHFHISFDLSPMARSIVASILLCITISGDLLNFSSEYAKRNTRKNRSEVVCRRYCRIRKPEKTFPS